VLFATHNYNDLILARHILHERIDVFILFYILDASTHGAQQITCAPNETHSLILISQITSLFELEKVPKSTAGLKPKLGAQHTVRGKSY
jgi:hypothetical protein